MVTDSQIIEATTELSKRGYPPSIREIGEKVGKAITDQKSDNMVSIKTTLLFYYLPKDLPKGQRIFCLIFELINYEKHGYTTNIRQKTTTFFKMGWG